MKGINKDKKKGNKIENICWFFAKLIKKKNWLTFGTADQKKKKNIISN